MRPKIQHVEFGNIVIDGVAFSDKDFFITNNNVEAVEKSHNIGIKDFEQLLLREPHIVIISTGFGNMVKIDAKIHEYAKKSKVELYTLPTPDAIKKYEELSKLGKNVIARIHVTC